MTTRDEVINAADCPTCGAERGSPCLGIARRNGHRRPRKSAHAERWKSTIVDTRAERERRDLEAIASLGARSSYTARVRSGASPTLDNQRRSDTVVRESLSSFTRRGE
jgi:hypothetical protein